MLLGKNVIAYEISEGSVIICDEHEKRDWISKNGQIIQVQVKPSRYVFTKIGEHRAKTADFENWQQFSASKKDDNYAVGRLSRWYEISQSPKTKFVPLPQVCIENYSKQKLIGIECQPLLHLNGTTWRVEPNGFFHSYTPPITGYFSSTYASYSNGKCPF